MNPAPKDELSRHQPRAGFRDPEGTVPQDWCDVCDEEYPCRPRLQAYWFAAQDSEIRWKARADTAERDRAAAQAQVAAKVQEAYRIADELDSNHARWVVSRLAGELSLPLDQTPIAEPNNRLREQLADSQERVAMLTRMVEDGIGESCAGSLHMNHTEYPRSYRSLREWATAARALLADSQSAVTEYRQRIIEEERARLRGLVECFETMRLSGDPATEYCPEVLHRGRVLALLSPSEGIDQ